jgi:GNAT superfamily N-acetyltransferase
MTMSSVPLSATSDIIPSLRVDSPHLDLRELTPDLWPALEALFGQNGACGGCWCMFWRISEGERYDDVKGPRAKARFKSLVKRGKIHGILAFHEGEPVGWCAFERRIELPRLDRAPSLKIADADRVWSLPCFFVKARWRSRGVAAQMLAAAEKALVARGAEIAEGYPVKAGERLAAAFAYTGVTSMFEACGFAVAEARPKGKQRYRKVLQTARSRRRGDLRD